MAFRLARFPGLGFSRRHGRRGRRGRCRLADQRSQAKARPRASNLGWVVSAVMGIQRPVKRRAFISLGPKLIPTAIDNKTGQPARKTSPRRSRWHHRRGGRPLLSFACIGKRFGCHNAPIDTVLLWHGHCRSVILLDDTASFVVLIVSNDKELAARLVTMMLLVSLVNAACSTKPEISSVNQETEQITEDAGQACR